MRKHMDGVLSDAAQLITCRSLGPSRGCEKPGDMVALRSFENNGRIAGLLPSGVSMGGLTGACRGFRGDCLCCYERLDNKLLSEYDGSNVSVCYCTTCTSSGSSTGFYEIYLPTLKKLVEPARLLGKKLSKERHKLRRDYFLPSHSSCRSSAYRAGRLPSHSGILWFYRDVMWYRPVDSSMDPVERCGATSVRVFTYATLVIARLSVRD
ncbi:unnamed protein product [Scytosiphon promiscuus]